jgi:branched-subunit amino acid aminotransferase/4-amino-4-deoxychorismate lyase
VLCAPNAETTWLDSITRTEIFAIANQMGIKTRTELARPADLVGLEVWALSSLQGIRPASEWVGLGSPLGSITHIESFQKRLRMLATQI